MSFLLMLGGVWFGFDFLFSVVAALIYRQLPMVEINLIMMGIVTCAVLTKAVIHHR